MKSLKYISYSSAFFIVLIFFSSCKKYLDVNTNPNNPEDVNITLLLPSAEAAIAFPMGYDFAVFGGFWSQYWTQSPSSSQYKTVDSYTPSATDFDRPWGILYNDALTDLKVIEQKATAEKRSNYVGISKILQAYTFQLLTDNFGAVPFKEAVAANQGNFSPKYDSEDTVYLNIIQMVKDGVAELDKGSLVVPGEDDLIYQGDMDKWKAFANTLLLRIYLRISDVLPAVSQAGIAELGTSGAVFLSDGETGQILYTSTGGSQNPMYESAAGTVLNGVHNIFASSTAIDSFTVLSDPRVDVLYTPGAGIPQGGYSDPAVTASGKAEPSAVTGAYVGDPASALAPVKFISDYESYFLQAEAVARGWLTGSAEDLYKAGIAASFNTYTLDTAGYIQQPSVMWPVALQDQLRAIALQKWLAMDGTQNIEAWAELRRFDYPKFNLSLAASGIVGGNLPARLFYPSTELTRNSNFPGQKKITDKVWWDKF